MKLDNTTIYRVLNFGAKSWWAHQRLRDMGKHVEARRGERRNILSDLKTVRSALYILVGHGRFVIITGPYSTVSGYGEMEHPLVLACVLRGVPCVEYSKLDRETTIIFPAPGPTFPSRTGQIQLLDDASFAVHAAIADFAGAQLYNIDPAIYERYVVSEYGNGWMVIDTENEKITEANSWLIAKAIMSERNGWKNNEFWKGEKWLPITFWNNQIKDEEHLTALIYSWGNDVDVFDETGECRFRFAHKDWSVTISDNMGLIDIHGVEKKNDETPNQRRGIAMNLNTKKLFSREFEQWLQILTDLSPKDMQALHEIAEELPLTAHPSTRNSLKRDNLIVAAGKGFKLTSLGETVYKRALDMLSHDWNPGHYLGAEQIGLLKSKAPVSVASRIRRYLGVDVENGAVKLAIFLGSGPQAYRQLSRCWGVDLASNDLVGIVGEPTYSDRAVRGELIGLTDKGIDLLTRVIPYLAA